MNTSSMQRALWRSRAVAILGFVMILFLVFRGLPAALRSTALVAMSFVVLSLGVAGSRHKSYIEEEEAPKVAVQETIVIRDVPVANEGASDFGTNQ